MPLTKILFNFPFWYIITIMSTTDDSSNRSEIIKVMNMQMKTLKLSEIDVVFFFQYCCKNDAKHSVMILRFRTDMPGQTVQTQIRLLLEEQSDQGLHCLPFRLHRLDTLLYGRAI